MNLTLSVARELAGFEQNTPLSAAANLISMQGLQLHWYNLL